MDTPAGPMSYFDRTELIAVALDAELRVEWINRAAAEFFAVEPSRAQGRHWIEGFVPAECRDDARGILGGVLAGGGEPGKRYHCPLFASDGTRRDFSWLVSVLGDPGAAGNGLLILGEDLRDDAERSRALFAQQDIAFALDQSAIVAITDHHGVITHVNQQFCNISGYTSQELLGKTHRVINSGHHPPALFREMWRTIEGGDIWRGELCNRAKDGSLYWVDTTIVPFPGADGKPYQYMAIRSDITERKEAQETLRRQSGLTEIGKMAAVVAHEVKNLLAGMGGALRILSGRMPADSPDREVLASILERLGNLDRRVRDLLLYARPQPPRPVPLELRALLDDIAGLLRSDPDHAGITLEIAGDCPVVRGDGGLLRDLFSNLLINACQAVGPGGAVRVELADDGEACRVVVRDDGAGMDDETMGRALEPFFSTKPLGSGLGLAIAERIVRDHEGSIELSSAPGKGTSVTVRLPCAAETVERSRAGTD